MAKYLDELSNGRAIWPFDEPNYPNIHEEYGFDERETFDLTYFLVVTMYERLRYFQEVASKTVDFSFHEVEVHGETVSQEECINRMVNCCRMYLDEISDDFDDSFIGADEWHEASCYDEIIKQHAAEELFYIYSKIAKYMWW